MANTKRRARTPAPSKPVPRQSTPLAAKYRQCRECQACCGPTLHINVPELVKPTGETCPHLCAAGCTLWATADMPPICQSYMCNYLVEPAPLTTAERPDQVGAIVQRRSTDGTWLIEYRPGGLLRTLANRIWGAVVRTDLRDGERVVGCFLDDPYRAEAIHVHWDGQRLGCELIACHADGSPVLVDVEPVHRDRPTQAGWFIPDQDFPFDARTLISHLGRRDAAILSPSRRDADEPSIHFRITRRQIEFLKTVLALVGAPDETRSPH